MTAYRKYLINTAFIALNLAFLLYSLDAPLVTENTMCFFVFVAKKREFTVNLPA
jgi:hypothetical protein